MSESVEASGFHPPIEGVAVAPPKELPLYLELSKGKRRLIGTSITEVREDGIYMHCKIKDPVDTEALFKTKDVSMFSIDKRE